MFPLKTSTFPQAKRQFFLHPVPAWTAIIGLFSSVALFLLVGGAKILVIVFPLGSFAVGIFLYRNYPPLYIGFTWWIWFLSAFIRRLIDYKCGFMTPGTYSVTALLVTSITLVTFIKNVPKEWNARSIPFFLCIACVLYGFLVRLIRQPILAAPSEIVILLQWLAPILFGFHLFINWRYYPINREIFQKVFLWAVLLMGAYGILQFIIAPEWDKQSMIWTVGKEDSWMGIAQPLKLRVWSTMDNPFSFAVNLMPGLLLLTINQTKLKFFAAGVGYLTFLLTTYRTAWYSWLVGVLLMFPSLKGRNQIRFLISFVALAIIVIPLVTLEPFSTVINERFETFSNLENDGSAIQRSEQLTNVLNYAFSEFIGMGFVGRNSLQDTTGDYALGFSGMDMGFLQLFISLGWVGTIAYITGVLLLIFRLFDNSPICQDPFAITARCIVLASIVRIATSAVTYGEYAMPIWGFLGISLAAHQYYLQFLKFNTIHGYIQNNS